MTRSANWAAVAAAAALLAFSFYAVVNWLEKGQLSDVALYQYYAGLMHGGAVPYRDFRPEYPPAALPVFLLPVYMPWSYATSFAVLMGVCAAGCVAVAALALGSVGAGVSRTWAALLAIGVSPIVLGSLFESRFDLWPTLLAVGAVAAIVQERPVVSGVLLGLGFAAKLWPAVLLPIALVHLWRRKGDRGALTVLASFLAAAIACFLPFALLAPDGLRAMFADQLDRPLQVESLGAAALMAAHRLTTWPLATVTSHGAQSLVGRGAGPTADLLTALELVAVFTVWIVFALRRDAGGEAVIVAAAAAVATLVAFDKVLSPQYLIWLVPVVALVRGMRGVAAVALLLLALGLTHTWFPLHYWSLATDYASPWVWYLLARDLALVALAAVLIVELSRGRDFGAGRAGSPAVRRAGA